jgi:hypothetical protein
VGRSDKLMTAMKTLFTAKATSKNERSETNQTPNGLQNAYSDESGHPFRSMSDSVPENPDSHRSEATLRVL